MNSCLDSCRVWVGAYPLSGYTANDFLVMRLKYGCPYCDRDEFFSRFTGVEKND